MHTINFVCFAFPPWTLLSCFPIPDELLTSLSYFPVLGDLLTFLSYFPLFSGHLTFLSYLPLWIGRLALLSDFPLFSEHLAFLAYFPPFSELPTFLDLYAPSRYWCRLCNNLTYLLHLIYIYMCIQFSAWSRSCNSRFNLAQHNITEESLDLIQASAPKGNSNSPRPALAAVQLRSAFTFLHIPDLDESGH